MAMLFSALSYGKAQVTVATGSRSKLLRKMLIASDQQVAISTQVAPPLGPAQVE